MDVKEKDGTEIKWSLTSKFPACQTIELEDYFPNRIHKKCFFEFNKVKNIAVDFHLEDRNFVLDRSLKSSLFEYSGPKIYIEDLQKETAISMASYLTQQHDSDLDVTKNCKNYPNENFISYKECDKKFVHEKFKNKGSLQCLAINLLFYISRLP